MRLLLVPILALTIGCDSVTTSTTDLRTGETETTRTTEILGVDTRDIKSVSGSLGKRSAIESVVLSNYDQILIDARNGGGPALSAAFDAAEIPAIDRPSLTAQLQEDVATTTFSADELALGLWLASEAGE